MLFNQTHQSECFQDCFDDFPILLKVWVLFLHTNVSPLAIAQLVERRTVVGFNHQ